MRAASVVGRVGGLAVALGIGVAMTTGAGLGLADTGADSAGAGAASGSASSPDRPATKTHAPKSSAGGPNKRARTGQSDNDPSTDSDSGSAKSTPRRDSTRTDTPAAAPVTRTDRTQRTGSRHSDGAAAQSRSAAATRAVTDSPDIAAAAPAAARAKAVPEPTPPARPVATPAVTDVAAATAPASTFVPVAADEPAAPPKTQTTVVLATAGPAPSVNTDPLAPAESPALLAFLASGLRESNRTKQAAPTVADPAPAAAAPPAEPSAPVTTAAVTLAAAAVPINPNVQSPQPIKPAPGNSTKLNWVTGPGITNAPSGTPGGYGVAGTDLGIMWDDGSGNILLAFGDTFDQPSMKGVWRSNVLLRSVDHNLADKTLTIKDAVISPGGNYNANQWSNSFGATQVVRDPGFLGLFGRTTTIIPTAAISVTDAATGKVTQYMNVMSVRTWGNPGTWSTNWSAIASSTDGGLHWTVAPGTVRSAGFLQASAPFQSGNQNFQQGAFVMGQAGDVDARGVQYVYSYGTPSGRNGFAYLSRVPADQILNMGSYQYWGGNSGGWVTNKPAAAVAVIGGKVPATGPFAWIQNLFGGVKSTVSELSIQYNDYLGQYVALYTDQNNNVVMRVSDTPQGLWSDAATLVANNLTTNTGMYAPMIHPWSGTDQLGSGNKQYLYWNLSWWGDYNVRLMQTDLSPMLTQV